jgi:hypothetical protein
VQVISGYIHSISETEMIPVGNQYVGRVILVLNKVMNGKPRKIAIKSYGKVAEKAKTFSVGQRVRIEYFLYSKDVVTNAGFTTWITDVQMLDIGDPKPYRNRKKKSNQLTITNHE